MGKHKVLNLKKTCEYFYIYNAICEPQGHVLSHGLKKYDGPRPPLPCRRDHLQGKFPASLKVNISSCPLDERRKSTFVQKRKFTNLDSVTVFWSLFVLQFYIIPQSAVRFCSDVFMVSWSTQHPSHCPKSRQVLKMLQNF